MIKTNFEDNINSVIFDKLDLLLGQMEEDAPIDFDENQYQFVDIVKFVEDDRYLHQKLYPWQMLILKVFYMGSHGNEKLSISFDPVEEACYNCVWNKNRLQELDSPCLSCKLYDQNLKKEYLQRQINIGKFSESQIKKWELNTELKSNFLSEMQMIFQDLTPEGNRLPPDMVYDQAKYILIEHYQNNQNNTNSEIEDNENLDDEILNYLIEDSRGSLSDTELVRNQIIRKIGLPFTDLVLVLGRRSGKSLLVAIIALYEAYRLIKLDDPQNYFGLLDDDMITIMNVAGNEDQGKDSVFSKIKSMAINSPFFKKHINKDRTSDQSMILLSPKDLRKNEERRMDGIPTLPGSIEIKSGTSKASGQVGKTCAVIIIDEVAEMIKKEDSKTSDSELYKKLKPSLATFGKYGKICVISNPLAQEGILWKLYNNSLRNDRNPLMFQLATETCNPSVDKQWLQEQKNEDPALYEMQYMAKFSEGASEPMFSPILIDLAIKPERRRAPYGTPGINYYAHADPATTSDNYALAVVHTEDRIMPGTNELMKYVIVDHVEMWKAKNKLEAIMIDEVDDYIIEICKKKFNVVSLSYDQMNSITSIQKMHKKGIKSVQTTFNQSFKEKIYETLLHLMQDERLEIYGSGPWVPDIKDQFMFLQKKYGRRGFRVQATDGHNDDIPDCIAAAAYMSLQNTIMASLPRIRAYRLNIDSAERMYGSIGSRRTGKSGW